MTRSPSRTFLVLHRERVGGHEGERPGGVEGPVAEVLHDLVKFTGHPKDLDLAQGVDAEG
jgi:hypothetical protein